MCRVAWSFVDPEVWPGESSEHARRIPGETDVTTSDPTDANIGKMCFGTQHNWRPLSGSTSRWMAISCPGTDHSSHVDR